MQTFLPYANFTQSAMSIDKKRCFKQVVEARQVLNVLEGASNGWKNHPAVKMWVGHTEALKTYFNEFLAVSIAKHKINTKYEPLEINYSELTYPWWLDNEEFHRAMRSRLIEKDYDFYSQLFPNDQGFNQGKYFWPVMQDRTFRVI